VFLAAGGADHTGRREQLLQIDTRARRASRRAIRSDERLEMPAAAFTRVFKKGHTEHLLYPDCRINHVGANVPRIQTQ